MNSKLFILIILIVYKCTCQEIFTTKPNNTISENPPNSVPVNTTNSNPIPNQSTEDDALLEVPYCIKIKNSCANSFSFVIGYNADDCFHTEGWYPVNRTNDKLICWKVWSTKSIPIPVYIYADNQQSSGVPRATDIVSSDGSVDINPSLTSGCILTGSPFHYSKYDGNIYSEYASVTNSFYQILDEKGEVLPAPSSSYSCVDLKKGSGVVEMSYLGYVYPGYSNNSTFVISCLLSSNEDIPNKPAGCCLSTEIEFNPDNSVCYKNNIKDFTKIFSPESSRLFRELVVNGTVETTRTDYTPIMINPNNSTNITVDPVGNPVNTSVPNNITSNPPINNIIANATAKTNGIVNIPNESVQPSNTPNVTEATSMRNGTKTNSIRTQKTSVDGNTVNSNGNTTVIKPDDPSTIPQAGDIDNVNEANMNQNSTRNNLYQNMDKLAQSYTVNDGCQMELYTEYNYQGERVVFKNNTQGSLESLSKKISSMKCSCTDPLHPNDTSLTIGGEITLLPPATVPCRPDLGFCSGLVCNTGDCNSMDSFNILARTTFDWNICGSPLNRLFCPIGYIMCNNGMCIPDPGIAALSRVACERRGGGLRLSTEQCVYCQSNSCFQRNIFGKYLNECTCETTQNNSQGPYAPSTLTYALNVGACSKCSVFSDTAVIFREINTDDNKNCETCKAKGCPPLDPRCAFCDQCVL